MIIPATPSSDAQHAPSSVDRSLRLAVAQSLVPEDPTDPGVLRESGAQIRQLMRDAAAAGTDLAQFPEGAITYPGKYVMSSAGPDTLAAADWTRINWDIMREEAERVAVLAGELGIWAVFGSLHPLTAPRRPHNSLTSSLPKAACSRATTSGTCRTPRSPGCTPPAPTRSPSRSAA